jgi:urea transporter
MCVSSQWLDTIVVFAVHFVLAQPFKRFKGCAATVTFIRPCYFLHIIGFAFAHIDPQNLTSSVVNPRGKFAPP